MKLLFADDHALFLDAMQGYIKTIAPSTQVECVCDIQSALDFLKKDRDFDAILLDYRMPGMNNQDCDLFGLQKIREQCPNTPIILMSGIAEREQIRQAIILGAQGYLPKTLSGREMMQGIQNVINGKRYVPLDSKTHLPLPSYRIGNRKNRLGGDLTPREREVLDFLVLGQSNKEIARGLDVQVVTVKLHVRSICRKLNANNRTQAALAAREYGLTDSGMRSVH
jgi:two-component system nitrate/nitrite response regulator NarL